MIGPSVCSACVVGTRPILLSGETMDNDGTDLDHKLPAEAEISEATALWIEQERGIPIDVAVRSGVVTWSGWPAFEYRDANGELKYRKLRVVDRQSGEKSFRRDRKNAETCLFGEDLISTDPDLSSPLVITEGEIDRLSILAAGIPNAVSVPDGAQLDALGQGKIDPLDDKAFGWLWDGAGLKPAIKQFNKIILAVDADKKGSILREELAVRLGRSKCYHVQYPEKCKDANEVLIKHGTDVLADVIRYARPLVPDRLVPITEIVDPSNGELFTSGFVGLDGSEGLGFNFMPPELTIITGAPGSGKSEFATILGAHLANHHHLPGAILQFEDRSSRVKETLIRYALNNVKDITLRSDASDWAGKWIRTIVPDGSMEEIEDRNVEWLTETLHEARTRHGCRWIILDPWNEMEHMWDRAMSEAQYTNDALRKLKRIARALNIILMVVVHPSKEGGRIKDITEMDLYGIAGAAAWANKADHGFIIHRPDHSKNEVFVKVAKSKDHTNMGRPGIVQMKYSPTQSTYRYMKMGV